MFGDSVFLSVQLLFAIRARRDPKLSKELSTRARSIREALGALIAAEAKATDTRLALAPEDVRPVKDEKPAS